MPNQNHYPYLGAYIFWPFQDKTAFVLLGYNILVLVSLTLLCIRKALKLNKQKTTFKHKYLI